MVINGGVNKNKPPQRGGPNTRSNLANRVASRGRGEGAPAEDEVMAGNNLFSENKGPVRSDSAKRRIGASAAAYHAMSVGLDANAMVPNNKNGRHASSRPGNDGFPDSLIEQLGTPEMLLKELKMVKRDNETLKNQLEVKEKSVSNYR